MADHEASDTLRIRVLRAGCDGEPVYEAMLAKGERAPAGDTLKPGIYGFEATALRDGDEVASRCIEARLPADEPPVIELASADCEPLDAGSAADDAEAGAPSDGEAADAEADATASGCEGSCEDPYPCTEDLCVNGACVHEPFTGPRECDGVECTEGDTCDRGSCVPGAARDDACPDDGDPCTTESCDPQTGCNRGNASDVACDDKIDCTENDACSNGVCRGDDMCTSGTCSAATGMCTSCLGPADCDDGDPCTTDTCGGGACQHAFNTASCNDGKSCTENDVCAGGVCAGVSTCPSDATCGGSSCKCNDSAKSVCGSSCVSLATDAQNCGQCGRACPSGNTCENGVCNPKPDACRAFLYGGHVYLVCSELLSWSDARARCLGFGTGLLILDNRAENDFLHDKSGDAARWIGANDRGNDGFDFNGCEINNNEGHWYWASSTSAQALHDKPLCTMKEVSSGSWSCFASTVDSATVYQRWSAGEPSNAGCSCGFLGCSEGEDCGQLLADGTWNDAPCNNVFGYVCESP